MIACGWAVGAGAGALKPFEKCGLCNFFRVPTLHAVKGDAVVWNMLGKASAPTLHGRRESNWFAHRDGALFIEGVHGWVSKKMT